MARLIVVEGPDLGREFEVPLRGGGIGRDHSNLVVLGDPSVSRLHCQLELRGGAMCLVDETERNRTLVNGRPVTVHALQSGDEVVVGTTRLAYLPQDGVAVAGNAGRVTMEMSSRQLLTLAASGDNRAHRYLSVMADLGERLRAETGSGPAQVAKLACDAALGSLGAERAFAVRSTAGRVTPMAAAVGPNDPAGQQLNLPREIVDKVAHDSKAVATEAHGRFAIAVPLPGNGEAPGIFWIDRRQGAWDGLDVTAAACLANIVGAAIVGAETRDELARSKAALEERLADPDFIGQSPAARKVLDFVARVAPSDATVLLGGESGSGKEMVARAIHRASRRSAGPCVAVNCAALTESLIESELFGHEKGAFTGATDKKLGRFELADKGTLFLDEIGEMPLGLQTKFLRVLEERRFERVGGSKTIEVDVRVVAATNRDLAEMVRRGTFREDLYYRISVIHVVVPPLRERPEDVLLLAEHFLGRFRQTAGRRIMGFSAEAKQILSGHAWPGNVRELRNAVERAVVLGEGSWIRGDDLPPTLARTTAPGRNASPTPPLGSMAISVGDLAASPGPAAPLPGASAASVVDPAIAASTTGAAARSLRELEKDGILAALAATGGNKAQAAALLEIDRSTLYKKLKDYGIG